MFDIQYHLLGKTQSLKKKKLFFVVTFMTFFPLKFFIPFHFSHIKLYFRLYLEMFDCSLYHRHRQQNWGCRLKSRFPNLADGRAHAPVLSVTAALVSARLVKPKAAYWEGTSRKRRCWFCFSHQIANVAFFWNIIVCNTDYILHLHFSEEWHPFVSVNTHMGSWWPHDHCSALRAPCQLCVCVCVLCIFLTIGSLARDL